MTGINAASVWILTEGGLNTLLHPEFSEGAMRPLSMPPFPRKERLEIGQKLSRLAGSSKGPLKKGYTTPSLKEELTVAKICSRFPSHEALIKQEEHGPNTQVAELAAERALSTSSDSTGSISSQIGLQNIVPITSIDSAPRLESNIERMQLILCARCAAAYSSQQLFK